MVLHHRQVCLGVTEFGQSGDLYDLYEHHGIDPETIVGAALDAIGYSPEPAYATGLLRVRGLVAKRTKPRTRSGRWSSGHDPLRFSVAYCPERRMIRL